MSPKENFVKALTFDWPDHVPYEDVVRVLRWKGDMMWFGESGTDPWGVVWESIQGEYMPLAKGHPLSTPEEVEAFLPPRVDKLELLEEVGGLSSVGANEEFLRFGFHPHTCLERAWMLMGMENFFVSLLTHPKVVKGLLEKIVDYHIEVAHHFLRLGVDGGWAGDDYGTQRALMLAPGMWREFIKPPLARFVKTYKQAGKWFFLHSCGHITEIIEDLIEIGVDIINPVQARANDLWEWGRRFGGRIVFHGGVDTQHTLMRGTPAEVRAEVCQRLRQLAGERGGLILAPDQCMPIPQENLEALWEEIKISGRYPIRV